MHRQNDNTKNVPGKTKGIWKFCKNTEFGVFQVLNSLILNIKDIAIFAANFPRDLLRPEYVCQVSFAYGTSSNQ